MFATTERAASEVLDRSRSFRVVVLCSVEMDLVQSSETLVPNHHATRRSNPENHDFYLHRHEIS